MANSAAVRRAFQELAATSDNILVSISEPKVPEKGQGWFNPVTFGFKIFDGRDWVANFIEEFTVGDTAGAHITIDEDAFTAYKNSTDIVFKITLSGTDVGDIEIANYTGDQGLRYDASEDTFDFKGTIKGITFIPPLALEYGENLTAGNALSAIHSEADNADITVSEDTYIDEANATTNYEGGSTLQLATPGSPNNKRVLLKFPSEWGSDILRLLSFDVKINVLSGGLGTAGIYKNTSSGDASTVTWNTKPSAASLSGSSAVPASGTLTISVTVNDSASDYSNTQDIINYGLAIIGGYGNFEALENAGVTPIYLTNIKYIGRDGKVYKADASYQESVNEFVGFCETSGNLGDTDKPVLYTGLLQTTGLTGGAEYYLSDTAGAISTSPGRNSKKVGRAVGLTYLIIKNDND